MADALAWQLRPGDTSLRWFARRPFDGVLGGVVKSRQGTLRLLRNLNGRADLYWGINPSDKMTGVRVSAKDITHWSNVLIDVDPVLPDADPLAAADFYIDRASHLLDQELHPTVIHSGRGAQVILSLVPLALDDHLRRQVRAAVGAFLRAVSWSGSGSAPHAPALAPCLHQDGEPPVLSQRGQTPVHGCIVDTSCSDLARVARMPETINLRTNKKAALVRWQSHRAEAFRVAPQSILALAGRVPDPVVEPTTITSSWQSVWHLLTARAQRFIEEGSSSPGRHTAAYACARSLRDRGVQIESAERVVLKGAALCEPPLPTREATRIVTCAYA